MADGNNKQPMSLNQRLQLLSASHSKPTKPILSSSSSFSVRKPFPSLDNDDVPNFSGITDFDSPSPAAKQQANIEEVPRFNLSDSPIDSDVVPSIDRSSLPLEEENSEKSESKLADDPSWDDAVSPVSTLAEFVSSSPSLDEPADDQLEVNPRYFTSEEDNFSSLAEATSKEALGGKDNTLPLSSVACFDSSPAVEMEPSDVDSKYSGSNSESPEFFNASDFDSRIPERLDKQQKKVKIPGRRRLCKISEKDDKDDGEGKNTIADEELNVLGVQDIDSPVPVKNMAERDYSCGGGGNEIMDILNDLSSRLEILSIEKKRPPRKIGLVTESENVGRSEVNDVKGKDEVPDYETVASTFSTSSESSSYSKGSTTRGASLNEFSSKCDGTNELEGSKFSGRVNKQNNIGDRPKKNEGKKLGEKPGAVQQFSHFKTLVQEEDDDECVIVGSKSVVKHGMKKNVYSKRDSGIVGEAEALDDCGEALVLETKDSFTLSDPKSSYRLPARIAKRLYPHQRDGLKWLWSLHCQGKGGILGDDMGLGKTMQICGFLAGLFNSNLIKRALIVAPKTLLPHWIKELSTVGLSHMTREYFGTCAKARQYELQYILQDKGILLTTYDILRNNAKSLSGDDYFDDESSEYDAVWDYMILDEGHLIKNPSTQRAKSLLEIPCAHRIIISGTPIQNNLKELWALFSFCCPELLGDKKWFKEKYENHILRGNNKDASDRDKRIGSAVAKELRERIQPYFLRRLKSEVCLGSDATGDNKLSKKSELIVWLRLTSCQRHIYTAFLKSEIVLSAFDGSPLAALTILKKICDHPLLLTKRAAEDVLEGMDSMSNQEDRRAAENLAMYIADVAEQFDITEKHEVSCKISFILSLLDKLIPEGHNVLIFSQTRKMLNQIQEALLSSGYIFMRIDGTTKASDRVQIVNDFQEGRGAPIFLLTSQVGGLGLTLTNADRVIVVDPAWNPSTDNQSVDRAYRIGQKKDVIVYRLMTSGTVEEKIYRKQVFKGGLFRTATEHKEQVRYFSQQDLRELFSLPKDGFDISVTQRQLQEEHGQQHTIEEPLNSHIKFLETLGIAGVSNHSLLFSKTAPVPAAQEDEELTRIRRTTVVANASSSSSARDNIIDGSAYAFNPKDLKSQQKSSSPSAGGPTEAEILEKINRLSHTLTYKATIAKLPDKGQKLQNQIRELYMELDKIRGANQASNEVIDLEDVSKEFQRVLNV